MVEANLVSADPASSAMPRGSTRTSRRKRVVIAAVHTVIGEALAAAFRSYDGFVTTTISAMQDLDFSGPNGSELSKADVVIMELGDNRLLQDVAALAILRANPKAKLATMLPDESTVTLFQPGGRTYEVLENPSIQTLVSKLVTPT